MAMCNEDQGSKFSTWDKIPRSPLMMGSLLNSGQDDLKKFRFSESDNSMFSSTTDYSSEETVTKLRASTSSSHYDSLTPTIFSKMNYDASLFSGSMSEGHNYYRNLPSSELGVIGQYVSAPPPSPSEILGLPSKNELLLELVNRTKYTIAQRNGQRSYGGPPPDWIGPPPPKGCEVFVGKIPRDIYEDELVPLFEKVGKIYELRLMMDFSGTNRGFCFVCFTTTDEAATAIRELDNFEIRPGKFIGVVPSVDNRKLWITGVPINATAEQIKAELQRHTEGLTNVYVYPTSYTMGLRTHCIAEYENHRAAALARRRLVPGRVLILGAEIEVDWAEPDKVNDELLMAKVRVLIVKSIQSQISEDTLWDLFNRLSDGQVERVKKLNHYAFVHFLTREGAEKALGIINEYIAMGYCKFEVAWSKPADKKVSTRRQLISRGIGSVQPYKGHMTSDIFGQFDNGSVYAPTSPYGMPLQNGNRCMMNTPRPIGSHPANDYLTIPEITFKTPFDKFDSGGFGMFPSNRF